MTKDVLAFAAEKTAEGEKVALVMVTDTSGSSPASLGQVMAVLEDGSTAGTVGGGASEYRVIQQAVQAIEQGEKVFHFKFDHAENGMVCGGGMEGYGNVLGNEARLVIFGGGHVAQSLAPIAAATGFSVVVVEDREEFAPAFEDMRFVASKADAFEETIPLHSTDFVVICTRGHNTDGAALSYCLGKPLAYIGMIGSKKKVGALLETMRKNGQTEEEIERIYAPIGLNIASAKPAEIAVAILAEILLVKNQGTLEHKKKTDA